MIVIGLLIIFVVFAGLLPPKVSIFGFILMGFMFVAVVTYALIAAKKSGEVLLMSAQTKEELFATR